MIEPAKFALFTAVSWALIIAPGPDMLYVITRGMAHGAERASYLPSASFAGFWSIRQQLPLE